MITEFESADDDLMPNLLDALDAVSEFYEKDGLPVPVDPSHVFVVYGKFNPAA